MTTLTQVQDDNAFEALTDEELESVDGGLLFEVIIGMTTYAAFEASRSAAGVYHLTGKNPFKLP